MSKTKYTKCTILDWWWMTLIIKIYKIVYIWMKMKKTSMKPFSFKGLFNANEMNYPWIKLSSQIKFCHTCNLPYGWRSLMMDEFYSWSILAMQMEIGHTNELYGWTLTTWIKLKTKMKLITRLINEITFWMNMNIVHIWVQIL